jgi:outer membrane protein
MKKLTTLIFLTMLFPVSLLAADLKVGVLNMKKLSAEAPQAELINKRLQELLKQPKEELDTLVAELETLAQKIDKDKLMSSPSQVDKMKQQYRQKAMLLQQKEAALNRGLQNAQARASGVFGEAVMQVVNKIAKDENYDLIMHEGVIFFSEKLDITDKVLKLMRQDFAQVKAKAVQNNEKSGVE